MITLLQNNGTPFCSKILSTIATTVIVKEGGNGVLRCFQQLRSNAGGGYFGQYKMVQKALKMIQILANRYSSDSTQRELSNEYQHDRV